MTEPTPKSEVKELIENRAKGFESFALGPGLCWVSGSKGPIDCGPHQLLTEHGWYIGGVFHNKNDQEVAYIAFPLPEGKQ